MRLMRHVVVPGATREDWTFDLVLAALAVVLVEVPYVALAWWFGQIDSPAVLTAAAVTGLAMVAPIVLRRHVPLLMMAAMTVAAAAQVALVPVPTASIVAVPFCAYTVARWVDGRAARSVVVVGALGAVAAPVRWILGEFERPPATALAAVLVSLVCLGLVVTPYAIGRRSRDAALARQAGDVAEAERYRILLSEREQRARVAEEAARNRIARDLHDVIAHSVSVMVVQADGGRALAAKSPEAAVRALDAIAETGREALTEMRRLVGVLREGPDDDAFAPSPGLAQLPAMVDRAGARLQIVGEPVEVPATVGLTAYRVVQEALTNVLKHAGPTAGPVVRLRYDDERLTIEVVDSGVGPVVDGDGRGNGLRGMRERVSAHGGELAVGEGDAGGFVVRAELPLRARREESTP